MTKVVLITGASSGFGEMTARELAKAGHISYASRGETAGRNAPQVEAAEKFSVENKVDLRLPSGADRRRAVVASSAGYVS